MKIQLSKTQWEHIGRTAGWMKKAQTTNPIELSSSQMLFIAQNVWHKKNKERFPYKFFLYAEPNGRYVLLGEFTKESELRRFVEQYYPNNPIQRIYGWTNQGGLEMKNTLLDMQLKKEEENNED